MPTMTRSDVQLVGAAGNLDILPPVGFNYEITEIGSSVWVGVPPNAVPQVNVGLFDGVLGPSWFLQSTDIRGWNRRQSLHIDNTNYLRLNNPGGAGANISYAGHVIRAYGAGATRVISDLQTIGAGANMDVLPPAGNEYMVCDVGASIWIGGAPANLPDCTVSIFDGVNAAQFMQGADARGWGKPLELYFNPANYLRLTNTNAAANVLAISGVISRIHGAAPTMVRSDVQVVPVAAVVDFIPAQGEEWRVTDIAADTWVGVAPAALPNVTAQIFDGVIASNVIIPTDNKGWLDPIEILIDQTNYLRLAAAAAVVVGISAVVSRIWRS